MKEEAIAVILILIGVLCVAQHHHDHGDCKNNLQYMQYHDAICNYIHNKQYYEAVTLLLEVDRMKGGHDATQPEGEMYQHIFRDVHDVHHHHGDAHPTSCSLIIQDSWTTTTLQGDHPCVDSLLNSLKYLIPASYLTHYSFEHGHHPSSTQHIFTTFSPHDWFGDASTTAMPESTTVSDATTNSTSTIHQSGTTIGPSTGHNVTTQDTVTTGDTTGTTITTTAAPSTTGSHTPVTCWHCTWNDCDIGHEVSKLCNLGEQCMTSVDDGPGIRIVTKTCGSRDACYQKWWQGTSDRAECLNIDKLGSPTDNKECTFCCDSDLCNKGPNLMPTNPSSFTAAGSGTPVVG